MRAFIPAIVSLALGGLLSPVHPIWAQTAPSGTVITIVGNGIAGFSGDGGPALNASLANPEGVTIGPDGTLYFSDASNFRIRALSPVTGFITTVAGNGTSGNTGNGGPAVDSALSGVPSIAVDRARHALYIVDLSNSWIRKVNLTTGLLTLYAGSGEFGFSGDGGPATAATLSFPFGAGTDGAGKLSIADTFNDRVRQVDPVTGIITTIAGNGVTGYSGDGGPATAASLNTPEQAGADSAGNVFVFHYGNANGYLRRIDATSGIINTVAGGGNQLPGNGPATSMNLQNSYTLAVDPSGTKVYLNGGDRVGFTGHQVFVLDVTTGQLSLFAGTAVNGFSGDGDPALAAEFRPIEGLALVPGGGLVIADTDNQRIRYVAPDSVNLSGDSQQTAFYLPWVSSLTGDFIVANNPNLTIVSAASLTSVGGTVNASANALVTTVNLGSLTMAGGSVNVDSNSAATTVNIGSLTMAGGSVNVDFNSAATTVNLGSLMTAGGAVNVSGNTSTTTVDLGNLTSAGGAVNVSGNTSTTTVGLGSLTTASGSVNVSGNTSATTVDLSSLTTVGGGSGAKANEVAKTVVGNSGPMSAGGSLDVSGNTAAMLINLRSLTTVVGNVTIASNAPNVSVNLNRLTSVGDGINPATISLQRGTFTFAGGLSVGPLVSLTGVGTLAGNVTNAGKISPGSSPGRFDITGSLALANTSELRMEIGGFSPAQIDFLNVAGNVTLGGALMVSLINNFQALMTAGASFTLLASANPLSGAFANVASGGSLTTTDGYARFMVVYAGANTVQLTGLLILDTDGDGMPDWWEDQFGFNKASGGDAALDSDGDGMSNLAEFRAGTDPRNPASSFRVTSLAPAGPGAMMIAWQSVAGKNYTVERSVDLQSFATVSGSVPAAGAQTSFTDSAMPAGAPKIFYRVRLAP